MRKLRIAGWFVAGVLLVAGLQSRTEAASMELEAQQQTTVGGNEVGIAGTLWVDAEGDVTDAHNLFNVPAGVSGHIAASWAFTITSTSGDDWDAVVDGGDWIFQALWENGSLVEFDETVDDDAEVYTGFFPLLGFAHEGTFAGTHGNWVENNLNDLTPGEPLPEVWTRLTINDLENPTNATGTFAVLASDPDNVMGLYGGEFGDTWSAFLGDDATGQLTAVPSPAAAGAGLIGLLMLATRRPRRSVVAAG